MRNKILGYLLSFSMVVLIICYTIMLSSCGGKDDSLSDFITKYASEYTVIGNEDDQYRVSVSAPDFKGITDAIIEKNNNSSFDSKEVITYATQHPECKKDYVLMVDECTEESIKKALLDYISYDLMATAFQNNEYSERWDTE